MRRAAASLLTLVTFAACDSGPAPNAQNAQVHTISTTPASPAALQPPPMLSDEAPPPKPKALNQWHTPEPVILTPEDEKVRGALPFTPAIAMDPIDGSKISIRANTPTFEHKGKIYYFSSEENRNNFRANPEAMLKGGMMRL